MGTLDTIFSPRGVNPLPLPFDPKSRGGANPLANPLVPAPVDSNAAQNPGATTGTSATSGAGPTDSHPSYPSTSPSSTSSSAPSTIDEIMRPFLDAHAAREKAFAELVSKGAAPPPTIGGFWGAIQKGAAIAGAAGAGLSHNPHAMEFGQDILDPNRAEREKAFQEKVRGEEAGLGEEERSINMRRGVLEARGAEADRAAQEQLRKKQLEEIDDRLKGGPEQRRIDMENKDRASKADEMRRAGYNERDIAEFSATGKIEKTPQVANEAELLLKAHEVGPDGKPTPAAVQAAAAAKDLRRTKLDEIHAAKDPNERAKLWRDLQTNDANVRGQLDRELAGLENNILGKNDPAIQAQVKSLKDQIANIDKDLEYVNGEIKKAVGMNPNPQRTQPTTSAPNYTVSAPGKPSVKKFLTPEQAKTLQGQGVQVAPIQQ